MVVYGLATCPDCKKAVAAFKDAGQDFTFRDIRAEPLSESEIDTLIAEFGDNLVDKSTNDWRGLSDWLKHSDTDAQIAANPKLMARPVIHANGTYFLGWTDSTKNALLEK